MFTKVLYLILLVGVVPIEAYASSETSIYSKVMSIEIEIRNGYSFKFSCKNNSKLKISGLFRNKPIAIDIGKLPELQDLDLANVVAVSAERIPLDKPEISNSLRILVPFNPEVVRCVSDIGEVEYVLVSDVLKLHFSRDKCIGWDMARREIKGPKPRWVLSYWYSDVGRANDGFSFGLGNPYWVPNDKTYFPSWSKRVRAVQGE